MNLFTSTIELEIRQANRSFYDAIESLKIEQMEDMWLNSETIQCIHPGWNERIVGWHAVMKSWYAIFQNTQYIEFNVSDFSCMIEGDLAVVNCTEKIMSAAGEEISNNEILATNVFQKSSNRWWLILHHGS